VSLSSWSSGAEPSYSVVGKATRQPSPRSRLELGENQTGVADEILGLGRFHYRFVLSCANAGASRPVLREAVRRA
jgi:hypothetical protein